MTDIIVSSGVTSSGLTVTGGDTLEVGSGGTAIGHYRQPQLWRRRDRLVGRHRDQHYRQRSGARDRLVGRHGAKSVGNEGDFG
jgi:hypothetical protein